MEKGLDFGLNGDTVDRMTADIQGSLGALSWPMAGYTYFVLRKNTTRAGGNCETRLQTFKFLEWFYTNSVVKSLAKANGFGMLPSEVRIKVWNTLKNEFRCDGNLVAVEETKVQVEIEVNSALASVFSLTGQVYTLVDSSLDLSVTHSDNPLVPANMLTNLGVPTIKIGWRHNMVETDGIAISPYAGIGMGAIFDFCGAVESCPFSSVSVKVSPVILASILDGTISSWSDIPASDSTGAPVILPDEAIIVVRSAQASDQQWDDRFEQKMQQFEPNFVYSKRSMEAPTNEAVISTVYGVPWSIAVLPFTSVIDSLAGKLVLVLNGADVSCTSDSVMSGAWPFVEHIDMAFPTTFIGEHCNSRDENTLAVGVVFARFVYWFNDPSSMLTPTLNNGMAYLPSDPIALAKMKKARVAVTCDGEVIMEPTHDLMTVSGSFKNLALFLMGLSYLTTFVLATWLVKNRKSHLIRASTLSFMLQILFGQLLSVTTVVFILRDDSSAYGPDATATPEEIQSSLNLSCQITPFIFFIGYGFVFTPLLLKNWRILALFNNRKLRKISIPNSLLLKYEAGIVGTMVMILLLWTINDPLTWNRTVLLVDPVTGLPIQSQGRCESETPLRYLLPLLAFVLGSLVVGNFLSFKARKIPVKYSEGKWIAVALINYLECFLLCIPIMIISVDNSSMDGIVKSMFVLICTISTMVIIFGPKLHMQFTEMPMSSNSGGPSVNTPLVGSVLDTGTTIAGILKNASVPHLAMSPTNFANGLQAKRPSSKVIPN